MQFFLDIWESSFRGVKIPPPIRNSDNLTCSISSIIVKYFQQVRSVNRNELNKFGYVIISFDGVKTSQKFSDMMSNFDDVISSSLTSKLF